MEVYPRRLLAATYDVKEEWSRALFDAFGPGGLLAREAPEFKREHLLWALAQLRCVNGRTGEMFTGDTELAQRLGYNTKDHPGKRCRETLTRFGFFTQHGKTGRAARLRLSAPVVVLEDFETLGASAVGDALTVTDTKSRATPESGASRSAEPSGSGSALYGDPFSSVPLWGLGTQMLPRTN
ncbi:hypothetical protein ACWGH2_35810 [Streptomyces sp. NPDC054871]